MTVNKPKTITRGIRFSEQLNQQIDAYAFQKWDGNFSAAVNEMCDCFLKFLSHKRKTLNELERQRQVRNKTQGTLSMFSGE